jgi:hypothetical protein
VAPAPAADRPPPPQLDDPGLAARVTLLEEEIARLWDALGRNPES